MMPLQEPINNLLAQLNAVVSLLTNEQFKQPIAVLSGATIGQHTRHILEFYIELNKGYVSGSVDYDQRERNHAIENGKFTAMDELQNIMENVGQPDKELTLMVNYNDAETLPVNINTNYYRELVYNLEHTVHHMALIRIGVNALSSMELPAGFGIATSTLKFRQACAP